ncbi:MAG: outer membrane protein assembly factor BamB [Gammaproteobacteria bacterium]|nr:outer membrane protein assembly factor BamB [Gammaproteobacteria bacterium]
MRPMHKLLMPLVFLCSVLVLTACASKDTTEPPAALEDFKPELRFKTLWKRDTGAGAGQYRLSLQPVISGDAIFTVDRKGELTALNKKTGKVLWSRDTDLPVSAGVGVGHGYLFIGTREGLLAAFAEKDGAPAWQAQLSSEILGVPTSGYGVVTARTVDGVVHAYSATTGEKLWTFKHNVPALSLRGTSSPIIFAGRVISGADNGRITALTLADGRPLWESVIAVPTGRNELDQMVDIDMVPSIDGGIIYVAAYQGRLAALTADRGQIIWSREKSVYRNLAIGDDQVYAVDDTSHVWAFDRNTGGSAWTQDKLHARPLVGAAVLGDVVLTGDFDGYVHALSKTDGRFVARTRIGSDGILSEALIEGPVAYVYTREGILAALSIAPVK